MLLERVVNRRIRQQRRARAATLRRLTRYSDRGDRIMVTTGDVTRPHQYTIPGGLLFAATASR